MSAILHSAASITPPVQEDNLYVVSGTASSQRIEIPDSWRKGFVTFEADGDAFYLAFGGDACAADGTATSTVTSNAFSAFDGDEAVKLADGESRDYDLRKAGKSVTSFAFIGTGTSGYLRITRSSGYAD